MNEKILYDKHGVCKLVDLLLDQLKDDFQEYTRAELLAEVFKNLEEQFNIPAEELADAYFEKFNDI